ncbi:hypothetical protein BCR33DRAFT_850808 [Rhizoclosmatium globosum]|uniref:G-protein coupled receptors family 3 profile domain-containing protein n=1 Tax=Rhizoclosmatium globosum TaxID=329046 RepID=A0A1Y2CB83_9FUNG|nr:hypothetical protein BCR33DRAFT_850808 [Rhizoclosmatium globosum]|eukprot:ORY44196.1 hypothetical protein BCR33DRAFT_850808 [Rhizoclosmatium globosum]
MDNEDNPLRYVSLVLLVIALCGCVGLFISVYHQVILEKRVTLTAMATSYNIQLLLIGISSSGLYMTDLCGTCFPSHQNKWIIQVLDDLFVAIFESCYLMLSWSRGSSVIRFKCPKMAFVMSYGMLVFPFVCFLPVVASITGLAAKTNQMEDFENLSSLAEIILSLISAAITVTMDAMFLWGFIQFLRKLQMDSNQENIDIDFHAVAQYGVGVHVTILLAFAFLSMMYAVNSPWEIELYTILAYGCTTIVFFILVALKVALHNNEVVKEAQASNQMDEAKEAMKSHRESNTVDEQRQSTKSPTTLRNYGASLSTSKWHRSNINIYSEDLDQIRSNGQ